MECVLGMEMTLTSPALWKQLFITRVESYPQGKNSIASNRYSFSRIMSQIFKNFGKLGGTHSQMTLCFRNFADNSGEVVYFLPTYSKHISFQLIFFSDRMHKKPV